MQVCNKHENPTKRLFLQIFRENVIEDGCFYDKSFAKIYFNTTTNPPVFYSH